MYIRKTNLYPVIVSVGNDVLSDTINSDAGETIEFAFCITVSAELFEEITGGVKYLNAMVGWICNDDGVIRTDGDASRPGE